VLEDALNKIMNSLKEATIYWIRLPEHTDIFTQGYVGVSKNFKGRINEHRRGVVNNNHSNIHLLNAALKYGWENLIKEIVLCGDEKYCYEQENIFRIQEGTGWNISRGGHRGPGKRKGSPGKKRTPEEQFLFDERRKRNNERRIKKIKEREERSKIRPVCKMCNELPARPNGTSTKGYQLWHSMCNRCAKHQYVKSKKDTVCSICNFVAKDECQLVVVDKSTLCHNCNALRLKASRRRAELTVDATVSWSDIKL
jgi:ribosomal protein L37E